MLFMSLVLIFTVAQETVTIKNKELTIPEDYDSLKSAYIDMATMYLEAEEDLDQCLKNNDYLIVKNKELNKLIDKAQENTEKAVENTELLISDNELLIDSVETLIEETRYWMNKKQYISLSPSVMYINNFIGTEPGVAFGVNTEILGAFTVGIHYMPITGYIVQLSYQVFSY